MAHSKGPTKGKKSIPSDSDELRKPAKLKPLKGKAPKKAKDVSAFDEDEDFDATSEDDLLFNEFNEDSFDDDDDDDF